MHLLSLFLQSYFCLSQFPFPCPCQDYLCPLSCMSLFLNSCSCLFSPPFPSPFLPWVLVDIQLQQIVLDTVENVCWTVFINWLFCTSSFWWIDFCKLRDTLKISILKNHIISFLLRVYLPDSILQLFYSAQVFSYYQSFLILQNFSQSCIFFSF